MNAVTQEVAEKDVESWLDHKKIKTKKRESQKDAIETLVESMMEGDLVLDPDTFQFKQKLNFPAGSINELVFEPRMAMGKVRKKLKGVKITEDTTGYIMGYVATLTNQPYAVIESIDADDYKIGQAIAGFFL
jgi:hypothetical protein